MSNLEIENTELKEKYNIAMAQLAVQNQTLQEFLNMNIHLRTNELILKDKIDKLEISMKEKNNV
jgi:hypothetical protein